jgi:hypothetical protein
MMFIATAGVADTKKAKPTAELEGNVVLASSDLLIIATPAGDFDVEVKRDTASTYAGASYPVGEIGAGDHVRVTGERSKTRKIRAREIRLITDSPFCEQRAFDLASASESETIGRIDFIDRREHSFDVSTPRGHIHLDVHLASDATGRHILLDDYRAGDRIAFTGKRSGNELLATHVRFARSGEK